VVSVDDVDELLELGEAAVQSVRVPGQDRVRAAGAQLLEQLLVLGAGLAGVGGDVVVGFEDAVEDGPAELVGEGLAVVVLPLDSGCAAGGVAGDAAVDQGADGHAGSVPLNTAYLTFDHSDRTLVRY
jgi:hypothetical protein